MRAMAGPPLSGGLEYRFELFDGFSHLQTQETQRGLFSKDRDQQKLVCHPAEMEILILSLVEQKREFIFSDHVGHGADGTEIPGCQGRQGIYVMVAFAVICLGNDVARHVGHFGLSDAQAFVWGLRAEGRSLPLEGPVTGTAIQLQLLSMLLLTLMVYLMIIQGRGTVGRVRGAALLLTYAAIMTVWTILK